jgi:hypothetical protein
MMKVLFMMEVMIDGKVENGKIADDNNGPNRYARHLRLVEKLEPFVPVIHRHKKPKYTSISTSTGTFHVILIYIY